MSQNWMIINGSALEESWLIGKDDFMKERLKMIGKNFWNDFINEIWEADRPELRDFYGVLGLRNQSKVGMIKRIEQMAISEERENKSNDIAFYNVPMSFVKKSCHLIRTRGFFTS